MHANITLIQYSVNVTCCVTHHNVLCTIDYGVLVGG